MIWAPIWLQFDFWPNLSRKLSWGNRIIHTGFQKKLIEVFTPRSEVGIFVKQKTPTIHFWSNRKNLWSAFLKWRHFQDGRQFLRYLMLLVVVWQNISVNNVLSHFGVEKHLFLSILWGTWTRFLISSLWLSRHILYLIPKQ